MRETINGLLEYIDCNCEKGRDDLEIGIFYSCIGALYSALDAIKLVEERNAEDYEEVDLE